MEKHKIILDTDIGSDVDDALALLFALKSDSLELRALSTVYGNTVLRAKIAKKLLDYASDDTEVYIGESTPLNSFYKKIFQKRLDSRIFLGYHS